MAARLEMDRAGYKSCRATASGPAVETDVRRARELGVTSTPTFLIGARRPDGKIDVTSVLKGARPIQEFDRVVKAVVSGT